MQYWPHAVERITGVPAKQLHEAARLIGERRRHSWQWWELLTRIDERGSTTVRARATDLAGRVQPETPAWNRLGYGANAIQVVPLRVS